MVSLCSGVIVEGIVMILDLTCLDVISEVEQYYRNLILILKLVLRASDKHS
jgi:hypothetical protein